MAVFKQKVILVVESIPYGKVASYGQVALMAGYPRGARAVGWILRNLGKSNDISRIDLPWWRVVNNKGAITIKGHSLDARSLQKAKLEEEGIPIEDDFTFDIEQYRFNPIISEYED